MQPIAILKLFAGLLALVLIYMLAAQEIPIFSKARGFSEVVTFAHSPYRFIGIFIMVAVVEGLLIKEIIRLGKGKPN